MKPFFPYYGSKWRSIPMYPTPQHETIIEPFAGSASYSVRHAHHRVILVDSDPVICGIWEFLTRVSEAEILRLPDLADGRLVSDLEVSQEARWLIGFWVQAGVSYPGRKQSAWMRRYPDRFWGTAIRNRIASHLRWIRHWKIACMSWSEIDPTSIGPATWFIDPPYHVAGRHYRHGSSGIDYPALGAWCRSLPGQTIVCEADGADWLPFRFLADVKATRRGTRSREAIWTSADATNQLSLF